MASVNNGSKPSRDQQPVACLAATMVLALGMLCGGCSSEEPSVPTIRLNQVGFAPTAPKVAVVAGADSEVFEIRSRGGEAVYSGVLAAPEFWSYSGEEVRIADFSGLRTPGDYSVVVDGSHESHPFQIRAEVYRPVVAAALKAFFFARSGTDLDPAYAGPWARQAGHSDDRVLIHASAASASRPEGSLISSPGGWYDAGDYNKYIVNSAFATATLFAAYDHFPEYFERLESNIPESNDSVPDIIDEAVINLRWMLTMQDPEDGGVYHKLTTLRFEGMVMPEQATADRYVVQKSTPAALDLAATAAMAARILVRWPQLEDLAGQCLTAAEAAWAWAEANPDVAYQQPADVETGTYAIDDDDFTDERAWAAVELFITTGDVSYFGQLDLTQVAGGVPSWPWVSPFGWASLADHDEMPPGISRDQVERAILDTADLLKSQAEESAYRVALGASPERYAAHHPKRDFSWGSSSVAASQSMLLLWAYRLTDDRSYLDAALTNLDYILGRNPTGYCFVIGSGSLSPRHPHHRPSEADGVADPVPGFMVGGPHDGGQDKDFCRAMYPSDLPARAYVDDVCSYATNEVAINWNAALLYAAGGLDALSGGDLPQLSSGQATP